MSSASTTIETTAALLRDRRRSASLVSERPFGRKALGFQQLVRRAARVFAGIEDHRYLTFGSSQA